MQDLLTNLLASVIAGLTVWLAERLVRFRRVNRQRQFFGIWRSTEVFLHVSRHASSHRPNSVHRDDVAALMELATAIKECGGHSTLVSTEAGSTAPRQGTEFCVGGPVTNPRTAGYLRSLLPGIAFDAFDPETAQLSFTVGGARFDHRPGHEEYAVLARVLGRRLNHPVFLIMGQRAHTNLATARFLVSNVRQLTRRYPRRRDFCLVVLVKEPAALGSAHVDVIADLTAEAMARGELLDDEQYRSSTSDQ